PADVPTSFRVRVKNEGMTLMLQGRLAELAGVDAVLAPTVKRLRTRCHAPLADVGVTMDLAATPEQFAAMKGLLESDTAGAKDELKSQEDSTAAFRCLTKGDPEAARLLRGGKLLPAGYYVALERGANGSALAARARALPGVYSVQDNTTPGFDAASTP